MAKSDIEGYDEALRKERRLREEIFLGVNPKICGIEIQHVTPLLLAWLCYFDTPFLSGRKCSEGSIVQFLWLLSPSFSKDTKARDEFTDSTTRLLFERWKEAELEIDSFLKDTFFDSPSGGKESRPYVTSIAWLIFSMARKPFKWKREETLHAPLRLIYQLIRCKKLAEGATLTNGLSDPIMAKYHQDLQEAWQAQKGRN